MAGSRTQDAWEKVWQEAEEAGDDPTKLLEVIESGGDLLKVADEARDPFRGLLKKAMLAGVPPQALYGKPYSKAYVLAIYNRLREEGADLPELTRGPRRYS